MFEFGKKYRYKTNQVICTCISAGSTWGLLQVGESVPFVTQAINLYEEYKEPQKITRYVNIWKKPDGTLKDGGVMYPTEEEALAIPGGGDKRAGVAKLEFTESV